MNETLETQPLPPTRETAIELASLLGEFGAVALEWGRDSLPEADVSRLLRLIYDHPSPYLSFAECRAYGRTIGLREWSN